MLHILLLLLIFAFFVVFLSFIMFLMIFYVPPRKEQNPEKIDLPPGRIYEPFYDSMRQWVISARNTKYETVSITSFDGLKLTG